MSEFTTKLVVSLVDDRADLWVLTEPLIYKSDLIGEVVIPAGFETDFASVPRIPFAYFVAGDTARYAAVVHDFLYGTRRVKRDVADRVFLEAMTVSEVPRWRRRLMYLAVRLFGQSAYNS